MRITVSITMAIVSARVVEGVVAVMVMATRHARTLKFGVFYYTIFLLKGEARCPKKQNMHGAASLKKKEDRIAH